MWNLLVDRDEPFHFPSVYFSDEDVRDCLPARLDRVRLHGYLQYQIRAAYKRYYVPGMKRREFQEKVEADDTAVESLYKYVLMFYER